jgi:hypothetical protein
MSNVGETVVAMLGATSLGATWTSCSPDFGAQAVADRFGHAPPAQTSRLRPRAGCSLWLEPPLPRDLSGPARARARAAPKALKARL